MTELNGGEDVPRSAVFTWPLAAGNAVLGDPESLGHADLRKVPCRPELTHRHLFLNQVHRAGLDLLALNGAQLPGFVIHVHRHDLLCLLGAR